MNGSTDDKLDRLFKAARAARPDTSAVEIGFETRVVARIRERREKRSPWHTWLRRLVPAFTAVVLILIISSLLIEPDSSQDVFAAITNGHEEHLVISYLTGE